MIASNPLADFNLFVDDDNALLYAADKDFVTGTMHGLGFEPDYVIRPGSRIVEVNGVRGDCASLRSAFRQVKHRTSLVVSTSLQYIADRLLRPIAGLPQWEKNNVLAQGDQFAVDCDEDFVCSGIAMRGRKLGTVRIQVDCPGGHKQEFEQDSDKESQADPFRGRTRNSPQGPNPKQP